MQTEPRSRLRATWHAGAALVAFAGIGLWITRPLVAHLRDHSLVAYPYTAYDVPLNAWILAWVSRALVTRPWDLFQANIYHPEPEALAYTEHMLGSVPFFGPAFLATGNPALALNVMILAGLVLSAAGSYWLAWRWTGSRAAAALAGLIVGFHATQVRALGPNLQTTQYLPFVLLFLDRVLGGGGALATIGLAAALTGQSLASYYYAYPTIVATGLALLVVCLPREIRPRPAALWRVALALLVTAGILGAVSDPYFRVAARGRDTIYTAALLYEETSTRLAHLWTLMMRTGPAAVPLAIVGTLAAFRRGTSSTTRRRVVILVAWVVAGLVLASGPTLRIGGTDLPMPDRMLDRWAPGFAALRDRRRLFVVAPVALGALAGLGIAALAHRRARPRLVAGGVALAALVATAAATDLGPCHMMALPTGVQVPPVYRELARREPGPVLELPVGVTLRDVPSAVRNTWYEYFSIFHWRPLLNGYASYWPPRLEVTLAMARALPQRRALDNLVACTGVRWVIAHTDRMTPSERTAFLASTPGLRSVERFADDVLYEVDTPASTVSCGEALRTQTAVTTIEGTPLASLPPAARRATIESVGVPAAVSPSWPPAAIAVPVRVRNTGPATWPSVALDDSYLVRLTYAWHDAAGKPLPMPWRLWTRLPVDLRPGETVEVPLALRLPPRPGDYRLQVIVRQGLQGLFEVSGPGATTVPVTVRPAG